MTAADGQTLAGVWQEAHPLDPWRYDYPDRDMAWWEMPTWRLIARLRRLLLRPVLIWHLLTTGPNGKDLAPWDDTRLWRRVKAILALLLPLPIRWHYPEWKGKHVGESVLIWWGSGITSTPSGVSWSAHYVGVGYGRCWHVYVWEDGE